MSDSFKRTLTDDAQASSIQSESLNRTYTSPELTAQLRNIGARVRKSVTEGYITPPTSRAFTKAQSTTTIFSSAKDINRDVFGPSDNVPPHPILVQPHKKRSRSEDHASDTELDKDNDHTMTVIGNTPLHLPASETDRAMKPLRKHKGMETRSLPVGAFRFSHQSLNPPTTMTPTMEAEEDWSVQSTSNTDQPTFKPVVFD